MNFIKNWFSKPEPAARRLTHPRDLLLGDMLQFSDSFSLPKQLRGQTFQVIAVNTYQFKNEHETEITLKGTEQELFYISVSSGIQPVIAVSRRINRAVVEQLFDLDQFALVFEEYEQSPLDLIQPLADYEGWLADRYFRESCAERGYYLQGDYRTKGVSDTLEKSDESLDYYNLISADEKASVEIEVYDEGETDVCLTIWLAIEEIKDMWPQQQAN